MSLCVLFWRSALLVLCVEMLIGSTDILLAQEEEGLFYRGIPYGSQSQYNPVSLIMNGSFDILQVGNKNNNIFSLHYGQGAKNVFFNITRPGSIIARYGTKNFWTSEVFPTSIQLRNAQYWPNYKLHLIGGGMSYYATMEWYRYHGFNSPRLMSLLTMGVYHYLNETVENDDYDGATVDPIADLLIFDPAGIILFSIDGVPEFFSRTLQAADWSNQPLINVPEGRYYNNGQNFSFKIPIPHVDRWKIFYLTGIEGVLGLTYRYSETENVSVGGGLSARDIVEVETGTGVRTQTTTLIYTGGIFFDRNNSLLASVVFGGARGYLIKANIYPGVFDIGPVPMGFVFLLQQDLSITMGITTTLFPVGMSGTAR